MIQTKSKIRDSVVNPAGFSAKTENVYNFQCNLKLQKKHI